MGSRSVMWVLSLAFMSCAVQVLGQDQLRFKDGKFEITVFSDLHFGEAEWTDCAECQGYDQKTVAAMNRILDKEKTDLAVLNGDLLSGEAMHAGSNLGNHIDRMLRPLVDRNVPWASTYGNHDRDRYADPNVILAKEQSYNSGTKRAHTRKQLTGADANVGATNYYLPVMDTSGRNIALILWFFDSRAGNALQTGNALDRSVAPEVVEWYKKQQADIRKIYGKDFPSIAFVHIPFKSARDLQARRKENVAAAPGVDREGVDYQGRACPTCTYTGSDVSFAQALVDTPNLIAVVSGHNHKVDWCMKWGNDRPLASNPSKGNGVNVCFGRRAGYGGYGKDLQKGARKILVREDRVKNNEVETWNRLEFGAISGRATLNSTYGMDKYPAAQE
ncbi:Metallo-dependent phosphatase [Sporormia fimetaria CBS 119925]|uniref:Metallo-dependent phosphatase n=1 Tax=Sporormia fimetaria CBS 119925 TaxID=1340428 RepID=A0A6A6VLW1_9PLEO|nr:Metallo-dependent phosphatase [Sporormia fimetaria CBS 119925]